MNEPVPLGECDLDRLMLTLMWVLSIAVISLVLVGYKETGAALTMALSFVFGWLHGRIFQPEAS